MSDENNSQDIGRQIAGAAGKAGKNKLVKKAMKKALKFLMKLLMKFIIKLILVLIKGLIALIGPWGLIALIAIILLLSVLDAVTSWIPDWFSKGGERTEVQELFDKTLKETLQDEHYAITHPLFGKLKFPEETLNQNDELNESDVSISGDWVEATRNQLTPSWTLTAAAYFNHVQLKGDFWHVRFEMYGANDSETKEAMISDIKDEFKYYFDDNLFKMSVDNKTESGEKVTTKTKTICEVHEEIEKEVEKEIEEEKERIEKTYKIRTRKKYKECTVKTNYKIVFKRFFGREIVSETEEDCENNPERTEVTDVNSKSEPDLPEYPEYKYISTEEDTTDYGYDEITIEKSKVTEEEIVTYTDTRTETVIETEIVERDPEITESKPNTKSLPDRQIPATVSTLYSKITIPYKYKETGYRRTDRTNTVNDDGEDCVKYTYKKYKVKVVDDSKPVNAEINEQKIIDFMTMSMPEGDKTTLIREKDVEYFLEMMKGLAEANKEYFPDIDPDKIKEGTFSVGNPSFTVPVQEGTFTAPTVGPVTSEFGFRNIGIGSSDHPGIDIGQYQSNTPIVAAAEGTVWRSYKSETYGNCVMIAHEIDGTTFMTVYAHMASRDVSQGQQVKKGQRLGIMGTTGESTGIHLHFEVHVGGYWNINKSYAQNPRNYVNFLESITDMDKLTN